MKNISFDNPNLLFLLIPFVIIITVPFVIAFLKGNKGKAIVSSFILHLLIAVLVTLAIGGMKFTTVMTETNVYVVADVSYSANRNLDEVDNYIQAVREELPKNSKMGVVCFGKDYQLLTEMGGAPVSVKHSAVDDSATSISSALNYTAGLFNQDVIKRIVLITDGKETDSNAMGNLIGAIENLYANNIYIDAIYLDDNISAETQEIQLSDVEFTSNTYLGHQTTADVLVQANQETRALVTLYGGPAGEEEKSKIYEKAVALTQGYNIVNFDLPTTDAGTYDYELTVTSDEDESAHNNTYAFTQTVSGKIKVLLISSHEADLEKVQDVYGEDAEIEAYIGTSKVPCTVEELCQYDEIVLSDTDVRKIENVTSFMEAVDKAVSLFGKSLVTIGDMQIQNNADADLKTLEDMLPVTFGNNARNPKLYGIVIDTSRSMQMASRLLMMKEAAIQLLNVLNTEDYVTVVSFSGDVTVLQAPTKMTNREEVEQLIRDIQPTQGTFLGKGLQTAYGLMKDLPYREKQVMLISDGMSYTLEADDPVQVATQMRASGILTSVINPMSTEGAQTLLNIARAGSIDPTDPNYYEIKDEDSIKALIFEEVADEVTEAIIERRSPVLIAIDEDETMQGVENLPAVNGYVFAEAKKKSTTVLNTIYVKGMRATDGNTVEAPLYSYWNYGNGKVSSFMSSLTGEWAKEWNAEGETRGNIFFRNVIKTATPTERIDYPYTLSVEYDGTYSTVEIVPAVLNPYATADVTVTYPTGATVTERLTFDSERYFYQFNTPELGKYSIEITYAYDDKTYSSASSFNISYSPEYDSFATFDASALHTAIRNRGTVSEENIPKIENNEDEVATYEVSFLLPFMIVAIVLYVVDIMIRKLKWKDIKSFFKKKKKEGV